MLTQTLSDIEIARSVELKPIDQIAQQLRIDTDQLQHYGKHKAKLPLSLIDAGRISQSKLILVSAISPTPAGEGKTTMSIGLTQGMNRDWQADHSRLARTFAGPRIWHQRRRCRRGLVASAADGRDQSAFYR